jgi:structure-specific recognition protein 1
MVSTKTAFEIPLNHISNSNIAGKTEVSLEFTNPDRPSDTPAAGKKKARGGDELVEMRFYVPGTQAKEGDDDKSDEDDDITSAQAFHDMIKDKAEIGQVTGEGIVVFSEVLVLTPR